MKRIFNHLSRLMLVPIAAGLGLAGFAEQSQAAGFVKFDGIEGESLDKDHKGWSDLVGLRASGTQNTEHKPGGSSTAPSRRRGDVVVEDIVLAMLIDAATTQLVEAAASGQVFPRVEIDVIEVPECGFRLTTDLRGATVLEYAIRTGAGEDSIEVTLKFEDMVQNYIPADSSCR